MTACGECVVVESFTRLRSKTPLEGYSVFLSYKSSMCKTEIKHPRLPFSNASQGVNLGGDGLENELEITIFGAKR